MGGWVGADGVYACGLYLGFELCVFAEVLVAVHRLCSVAVFLVVVNFFSACHVPVLNTVCVDAVWRLYTAVIP